MSEPLIGIVGGYGAVGRAAAGRVRAWGTGRLRIGGRDRGRAEALAAELGGGAEAAHVDYSDAASLERFCNGCSIVANCAGPSHRIMDAIARAALAAGADYVDAYGDDPVYQRLGALALARRGRIAVLSAGVMPGLAGLLPRWLATQGFDRARRLRVYVGGLERVTPAAAADYLLSLGGGYGEALAAWRSGGPASRALAPLFEAELPFFPRPVTAYPYLSTEAQRVARSLGLEESDWYNVFDGSEGLAALNRLQAEPGALDDLGAAAAELSRAAELDLFGRTRYQILLLELSGERAGVEVTRALVVQAPDGGELSGTVNALAINAVLRGEVPPGLHYAADVLDPATTIDRLRGAPAIGALEVIDGPASASLEEGEL